MDVSPALWTPLENTVVYPATTADDHVPVKKAGNRRRRAAWFCCCGSMVLVLCAVLALYRGKSKTESKDAGLLLTSTIEFDAASLAAGGGVNVTALIAAAEVAAENLEMVEVVSGPLFVDVSLVVLAVCTATHLPITPTLSADFVMDESYVVDNITPEDFTIDLKSSLECSYAEHIVALCPQVEATAVVLEVGSGRRLVQVRFPPVSVSIPASVWRAGWEGASCLCVHSSN